MSDVVTTVGIDIGKTTFHLIGFDGRGAIVLRQKVSRAQLERRFAALPRCLVGHRGLLRRPPRRPAAGRARARWEAALPTG